MSKKHDGSSLDDFLETALKTCRSQVDWLPDPTADVVLSTLQHAAALVSDKLQIQLV